MSSVRNERPFNARARTPAFEGRYIAGMKSKRSVGRIGGEPGDRYVIAALLQGSVSCARDQSAYTYCATVARSPVPRQGHATAG